MRDQYDSLVEHLVSQLRRFAPPDPEFTRRLTDELRRYVAPEAHLTIHLRGPEIETGGPPNEIALTWELRSASDDDPGKEQ